MKTVEGSPMQREMVLRCSEMWSSPAESLWVYQPAGPVVAWDDASGRRGWTTTTEEMASSGQGSTSGVGKDQWAACPPHLRSLWRRPQVQ